MYVESEGVFFESGLCLFLDLSIGWDINFGVFDEGGGIGNGVDVEILVEGGYLEECEVFVLEVCWNVEEKEKFNVEFEVFVLKVC